MFRLLVVLGFLSCAYGFPRVDREEHEHNNETEKIVGGQQTTINKHPYQVSMITNDGKSNYVCGGSIIGKRWILTAAHCMNNIKTITVRTGSTQLNRGGKTYVTKLFKVHPSYRKGGHDYDVAVVNLPKDIVLNSSTVKIVSLAAAGSSVSNGTNTIVSGWGTTKENGETSNTLRDVTVPVIDRTKCASYYKKTNQPITARMLCAGFEKGGKDSCQGDSGGPQVLSNGKQVGIVSFGNGCARANFPGVYCDVGSVRTWIKQATGI